MLAWFSAAHTQQPAKVARTGIVRGDPNAQSQNIKIFQLALQQCGYVEEKNILYDFRYTEGSRDRAQEIVAELVNLKADIIFSMQAIVIHVAKRATKTIPIVMAITQDPVSAGLVDSLADPGENITGITSLARNLSGKRLELVTEMTPRASRVGILSVSSFTALKDYQDAARSLKVPLQPLEVRLPNPDLPGAFQVAKKERVSAIIAASVPGLSAHQKKTVDLALQNRVPLFSENISYVEIGGLAFYGAKEDEIFRRAAIYVDKILKGTKPSDLIVEQPTKFEFVINLKTAKQIGLIIPPNVLARADRVIR